MAKAYVRRAGFRPPRYRQTNSVDFSRTPTLYVASLKLTASSRPSTPPSGPSTKSIGIGDGGRGAEGGGARPKIRTIIM